MKRPAGPPDTGLTCVPDPGCGWIVTSTRTGERFRVSERGCSCGQGACFHRIAVKHHLRAEGEALRAEGIESEERE